MTKETGEDRAVTLVDRGYQLAYASAYRLMRRYWKLRHPDTHGALVTVFNDGEVLLVKNSYVPYYSLPGGYVHRGEAGRDAARRELLEETGLIVASEELTLALDVTHEWEGKRDHVEIYTLEAASRPRIAIDHREVVEASWFLPEAALKLNLFPPIRSVLTQRLAARK